MSKRIKTVYDQAPTLGDDSTTEGYTPFDDGTIVSKARSDTQLAEIMRVRLGLNVPSPTPGDTTAPVIASFTGSIVVDSLSADISILASDNVAITGWIIKEDDTSLPATNDADWLTSEPQTFTVSNTNPHDLTLRTRDAAGNVSSPSTITVTPTTTSAPTITTFTTVNPASGSSAFLFDMTVTGSPTHRMFVYGSNTPPALGDGGWIADTFPITGETATLGSFSDTTVYAYVKDASNVSSAVTSFVDVTIGGDTSGGDYLWINNPTLSTSTLARTYSGSGTLTLDGAATGLDGDVDASGFGNVPTVTITGTYSNIEIINFDMYDSRSGHIKIDGIANVAISIRNNKLGKTNTSNEAVNLFRSAISVNNCDGASIDILGNWFDFPDGCIILEETDNASCRIRHNFVSGMIRHNTTDPSLRITNFVTGRFGSISGDITENIFYEPTGQFNCQDILNLATYTGTSGAPFTVTRNRFWVSALDDGNNAAVQIGDKTYNAYVDVNENTFIDTNSFGQFSAGQFHSFRNNKGYTSEAFPGIGAGYIFHIQRQGITAGKLHDTTFENNTFLHFYDNGSGTPIERGIYFPNYGRENPGWVQSWPNHGVCVGTCDISDNTNPNGYSNNDLSYQPWANGQGKSELWRQSWNSFSYAGSDGLTPTISYDSPWIGDGGSQSFSAGSSTSTSFGDQSTVADQQFHSVFTLLSGGTSPFTLTSVSTSTATIITVAISGDTVQFNAVLAGAFTYTYTVTDSAGLTASGTISGTVLASSSTSLHFDQNGQVYISIDPTNYHDYFPRGGYTWTSQSGGGSPDGTYMQCNPYSGSVLAADVETGAAELVYRIYFDAAATYTVYVNGMALGSSNYDTLWVGFDDVVDSDFIDIDPADSTFQWDDGTNAGSAITIVIGSAGTYTFHCWVKEGGFALGKIVITSGSAPTGSGPAESPETLQ